VGSKIWSDVDGQRSLEKPWLGDLHNWSLSKNLYLGDVLNKKSSKNNTGGKTRYPGDVHHRRSSKNRLGGYVSNSTQSNDSVCLFVWTYLDTKTWKSSYLEKFLRHMDNTLLNSIDRQCPIEEPCTQLNEYMLIINIKGNVSLTKKITSHAENWKNVIILQNYTAHQRFVSEVLKRSCNWVSYTYIDADDAFLDGYFQYVSTDIVQLLTETLTVTGRTWRGGIFIPRSMPRLIFGNSRCTFGDFPKLPYCSGFSAGRGFILQKNIWMNSDIERKLTRLQNYFVQDVRYHVMHSLGYSNYIPKACGHGYFYRKANAKDHESEIYDSAVTRILLIDVTSEWKTSGILIVTPFSANFPWASQESIPICDEEQISAIQNVFPRDISNILEKGKDLRL